MEKLHDQPRNSKGETIDADGDLTDEYGRKTSITIRGKHYLTIEKYREKYKATNSRKSVKRKAEKDCGVIQLSGSTLVRDVGRYADKNEKDSEE
jgi:hypothetical protein